MRSGIVSGCGAASGTMLLLVVALVIAQPNLGVLERAVGGFFADPFGREDAEEPPEALVDELSVGADGVRGRVRNPSTAALGRVDVRVRLIAESGEARTASTTVYGLAPGAESWFGIPLIGGPAVARVELVDVRATASADASEPAPARQPRRGGVGGMQDVERMERNMKQMEEATRAATGG